MTPTETLDRIHEIHDLASRAGFELEEGREPMAAARLERCAFWATTCHDEIVSHWSEEN